MFTAKQYRAKAAEYTELLKATSLPAEIREFRRPDFISAARKFTEVCASDDHSVLTIAGLRTCERPTAWLGI